MSVRFARPLAIGSFLLASAALAAACNVEETTNDTGSGGDQSGFTNVAGTGGTTTVIITNGGTGGTTVVDLGGAGGTPAETIPTAWVRIADFAQTSDAVDICFRASTDTTDWSLVYPRIGDATTGYGHPGALDFDVVTTLTQSDPGTFDIRIVTPTAPNCGDAYLVYPGFTDQEIILQDTFSYTVAILGTSAEAALTVKALPDAANPIDGTVSLQALNALSDTDGNADFGVADASNAFTPFASNVGFSFTGVGNITVPIGAVHIDVLPSGSATTIATYPRDPASFAEPTEFFANSRRNVYIQGTKVGDPDTFNTPFITVCDVPGDLDSEAAAGVDENGVAGGIRSPNCVYAAP